MRSGRPLDSRELAVLRLLREDRDRGGDGVEREDIIRAAGTRWPESLLRRLHRAGYVVAEDDGRYQLGHDEPPEIPDPGPTGPVEPWAALSRRDQPERTDTPTLFDVGVLGAA